MEFMDPYRQIFTNLCKIMNLNELLLNKFFDKQKGNYELLKNFI
jgi:hypothetical protein